MKMEFWQKVSEVLPKDGLVVMTKIEDENGTRNKQELKRRGSLWFYPSDSMYAYYTPTHWLLTELEVPRVGEEMETTRINRV